MAEQSVQTGSASKSDNALRVIGRVKAVAITVVGIGIAGYAVSNYLKWSESTLGVERYRVPRILSWAFDTLGFVPATLLQIVLGLAVVGYAVHVWRNPAARRDAPPASQTP